MHTILCSGFKQKRKITFNLIKHLYFFSKNIRKINLNTIKKVYLHFVKINLMKKILLIVIIGLQLTSCIPTKDLTYFQGEPQEGTEVSSLLNKPYRLQINDIIDIQIKANDENLVALFKNVDHFCHLEE